MLAGKSKYETLAKRRNRSWYLSQCREQRRGRAFQGGLMGSAVCSSSLGGTIWKICTFLYQYKENDHGPVTLSEFLFRWDAKWDSYFLRGVMWQEREGWRETFLNSKTPDLLDKDGVLRSPPFLPAPEMLREQSRDGDPGMFLTLNLGPRKAESHFSYFSDWSYRVCFSKFSLVWERRRQSRNIIVFILSCEWKFGAFSTSLSYVRAKHTFSSSGVLFLLCPLQSLQSLKLDRLRGWLRPMLSCLGVSFVAWCTEFPPLILE